MTLPEPKRLCDRQHLRFVAKKPCLVCGREPCDPHHLRFVQPRGLAQKVSDEFTVPLCRAHHTLAAMMLIEEGWLALPYPNPAFAKVEVGVIPNGDRRRSFCLRGP